MAAPPAESEHLLAEPANHQNNETIQPVKPVSLYSAACAGNSKAIVQMIQSGNSLNALAADGNTPLLGAVNSGSPKTVATLLEKGADIGILNPNGDHVLHVAAREDRREITKVLLKAAPVVDVHNMKKESPIQIAVSKGHAEISQTLHKAGANINQITSGNNSLLHLALENGHSKVATMLIKKGAKLDIKNESGNVPLHLAATKEFHDAELVKLLVIEGEAQLGQKNQAGDTPLHVAARGGHYKAIQLFLNHSSAEVDVTNNDGDTPLHLAAKSGYALSGKLIMLHNKNMLNKTNREKHLPIHKAVMKGRDKMVEVILSEYGRNEVLWQGFLEKARNADRCLMDMAVDSGNTKVAALLIQFPHWQSFMLEERYIKGRVRVTPMRRLIQEMPDIAKLVMDRSWEIKNDLIIAHFELLDDMFCKWGETREQVESSQSNHFSSKDSDSPKIEASATPYTKNVAVLKRNHPLRMVAEVEDKSLIDHPLIQALLRRKWGLAVSVYLSFLIYYIVLLVLMTSYMLKAVPPYGNDPCQNGTMIDASDISNPSSSIAVAVCVFASLGVIMECIQLLLTRVNYYIHFHNLLDWFTYIAPIIVVSPFTDCGNITDWQFQLGVTCLFISYMNMLFFLRIIPLLGIYVMMIAMMLMNLLQFFTIMFLFITSFGICFYMLIQKQVSFSTPPFSVMKTYVMMLGDLELSGIFHDHRGESAKHPYYETMTWLLYITFLVFMSLIIMNLLTSLSVWGVNSLQEESKYKILALQIELALDVEFALPWLIHDKLNCVVKYRYKNFKRPSSINYCIDKCLEKVLYGSLCEINILKEARRIVESGIAVDELDVEKNLTVKDVDNCIVRKTREMRTDIKEIDKSVELLKEEVKKFEKIRKSVDILSDRTAMMEKSLEEINDSLKKLVK